MGGWVGRSVGAPSLVCYIGGREVPGITFIEDEAKMNVEFYTCWFEIRRYTLKYQPYSFNLFV